MRLALAVPVLGRHDITLRFVNRLLETVIDPTSFALFIIDNGSAEPFPHDQLPESPFPIYVKRNEVNRGFYEPLEDLIESSPFEILALAHNDCFIYEVGWDRRLREAYVNDKQLGIVGFCGSDEVDIAGGRGSGTMCFFRGEEGQTQAAGKRITGIRPAAILDSLFMAFRREVALLVIAGEKPTPAHFYDKIWPMRAIEDGWRVAVLGVEVDHLGGTTLVAEPQFWPDMARWCEENGIDPGENPTLAVYLEAERRWLSEYRDTKWLMPGYVGEDYVYRKRR